MRVRTRTELGRLRCCQSLSSSLRLAPGLELPGVQCLYLGAGGGGLSLSLLFCFFAVVASHCLSCVLQF